jgi:RND family efflux transporter MFP subunit
MMLGAALPLRHFRTLLPWGLCVYGLLQGIFSAVLAQSPAAKGPPPAIVAVEKVEVREVAAAQSFVGTLQPRRRSVVGSAVDGRVAEYLVTNGQWVTKREPIAKLLTETTTIELEYNQALLLHAEEVLHELEHGSRPEEIVQAKAKLESCKAVLEYTRSKNVRTETLAQKGGSMSQEERDQARSQFAAAEQEYAAAQANLEMVQKGPRDEKISQAKAQYAAQKALVRQLEDRLEKFTIRAPYDGYVVSEFTEVGAWIKRGDPIAEVIEVDPLEVDVAVSEATIGNLQEAMTQAESLGQQLQVVIKVDSLGSKPFVGFVEHIVPQADLRTRTFPVKMRVENPKQGKTHTLKAGMICHAMLPVGKTQPALLIPKDALVLGGPSPMVFVAQENAETKQHVAQPVPVQIGAAFGSQLSVTGDLKSGMLVITRGNERLFPGQPLSLLENSSK